MIARFFHGWETRLADINKTERVVRPFEWGLDWMPVNGQVSSPNCVASQGPAVLRGLTGFVCRRASSGYKKCGTSCDD